MSQTLAAFARQMGVHRSQATRWAQAGMPTLQDGRVDPAAAERWVQRNVDPGARAMRQQPTRRVAAADTLTRTALWLLAQRIPAAAASWAAEAGATPEMVRDIHQRALRHAAVLADDMRAEIGLPAGEGGPWTDIPAALSPLPAELRKVRTAGRARS